MLIYLLLISIIYERDAFMKKDVAPAGSKVKLDYKKHLVPPLFGLSVTFIMLAFFNSQAIAGKIAASNSIDSQATAEDLAALEQPLVARSESPKLIINKLNVEAPVDYTQSEIDEASFQAALRSGVVYYPNTSLPGSGGNTVIFGHSSGQVWTKGDYKFIFASLDKLEKGDKIIIEYSGKRYIYSVSAKRVVSPTDLSVLNPTDSAKLTLITCTPVGTNKNRLIIEAEQIAPSTRAASRPVQPNKNEEHYGREKLPSNTDSIWEDIKSIF